MNADKQNEMLIRVHPRLSAAQGLRTSAGPGSERAAANKECPQGWGHGSLDRLRYAAAANGARRMEYGV